MTSENRPTTPGLNGRPPSLPRWGSADVHRGLLTERMRSVRRWVISASFLGTAAFSILAGLHTAASTASSATATSATTSTTAGVAQTVSATTRPSIFSGQTGSVALSSVTTTGSAPIHVRTSSS